MRTCLHFLLDLIEGSEFDLQLGAHVFGIANSNSVMTRPNDELLDEVFPGTPRKRPLLPNESLISIEKARRVLGYVPEFEWVRGAKT